jgi:hypothetical protein
VEVEDRMSLPALKIFADESECKQYFVDNYCNQEIFTHDGIRVKFHEDMFEHAFYIRTAKKWKAQKDYFATDRGEHIDWIKYVLQDPTIVLRQGYDKARKRYDNSRRVAFMAPNNYVVIILIDNKGAGRFVTAYLVDSEDVANKISGSPVWVKSTS